MRVPDAPDHAENEVPDQPVAPSFITMLASHPVSRPTAIDVENITAFIVHLLVVRLELYHYICYITNGSYI
jgi:hypothetical protein